MNEFIFLLHIIIVVFFTLTALFIGKNALITFIAFQSVLANLFVIKQITLFGFNVTCADVFIVGSVLSLNLLQEYFGKNIAKKTVWISFFIMFFYLVMSQIHLLYKPSIYDFSQTMFLGILRFAPRIIIASLIAFFITRFLNIYLYNFLKNKLNNSEKEKNNWIFKIKIFLRNLISIICTQFLDTILFSFLGLYGIVGSIWQVITVSFFVKVIVALLSTPFVIFSKKIVRIGKKSE